MFGSKVLQHHARTAIRCIPRRAGLIPSFQARSALQAHSPAHFGSCGGIPSSPNDTKRQWTPRIIEYDECTPSDTNKNGLTETVPQPPHQPQEINMPAGAEIKLMGGNFRLPPGAILCLTPGTTLQPPIPRMVYIENIEKALDAFKEESQRLCEDSESDLTQKKLLNGAESSGWWGGVGDAVVGIALVMVVIELISELSINS